MSMKSIRAKIMWLLFSSVFIASVIIGAFSIVLTSDIIKERSTENMQLLCKTNADKIDITFAKIEDSVDTLAHYVESDLPDIQMLKDDSYRAEFSAAIEKNALHHIESVDGAVAVYLYYDPAITGKADGFFYAKHEESEEFVYHPLSDISQYPPEDNEHVGWWYIPTVRGAATWLEAYYDANLGRYVISYIVPIYKNEQLIGVVGADISTDHIVKLVKEVSVFTSGKAAVLKSDGTVLYHPNFERGELIGEGDPGFDGVIEQLTKEDATSELISYKLKDVDKKLASCKLRNGMLMVCFAPVSEIYQQQSTLIVSNLIITGVVVLVALFVAFLVSTELVRPIKNLNEAAKHLTDGEFDFDIHSDTCDEIGELTATFIETRKILKQQFYLLDTEAHRDGLTGVGNKSAFMDKESEINDAIASGTANFSIAVFDVNGLKVANDIFGHMAGDRLLLTVANHLSSIFDSSNVYRLGGDEFVVIIPEGASGEHRQKIAECVRGMKNLSVEGYPDCKVSCAVGSARLNKAMDHQLSDVLRRADKEMYKNKSFTKQEAFLGQEGAKSIKQLQIDKYCQLLESLKESTDDYLFLMDLETGAIRFFGGSDRQFDMTDGYDVLNGISDILKYVHANDYALVEETILSVMNRDAETIDVNFRMKNNNNMGWVSCRGNIIKEEMDSHFVLIGRMSQNALKHLYNPVTVLFNKAKLTSDLQNGVKQFSYLMLLDIDNLHEINLKHGKSYGDDLLKMLAEKLEDRFSLQWIYHAEKDRFVVLLDVGTNKEVEQVFDEIQSAMTGRCSVSASVVPNSQSSFISPENIYDYAVQTMINSKREGSGQIVFFSKESLLENISTVELWEELNECVANKCDRFYLMYQPQVSAEDYSIVSAEALLRFNSKTKGTIYPDQFIPVLEQTGLIHEVGLWVVNEALGQYKQWRGICPDFKISVNVSAKQLKKKDFATQIKKLLAKHGLSGEALILEITESSQLNENQDVFAVLGEFRQLGIQIAIDDFGTGYSNLGNLKHIHANILKIDRIFIRDIKENGYNYHLIHNVIEFAKANDLKVCLEGVENSRELVVLSGLDSDTFQGYLFDKPGSVETIEARYFLKDSEEYGKRLQQIDQLLKERKHGLVVNMETKTILRGMNIGLWIIRIDAKTGVGEFYADDIMKEWLGVNDTITPEDCYNQWWDNIQPEHCSMVADMMEEMKNTDKVIQAEYSWHHPQKGEIAVRCSGRCVEKSNDVVVFEGFHRALSDLGKSFY